MQAPDKLTKLGSTINWPKGKLIEETCGFIAKLTALLAVGTPVLGFFWSGFGQPGLSETLVRVAIALMLGLVWIALRRNRLQLARIALLVCAAALAVPTILAWFRIAQGRETTLLDGAIFYMFFPCVVALFLLAQREVGRQMIRTASK